MFQILWKILFENSDYFVLLVLYCFLIWIWRGLMVARNMTDHAAGGTSEFCLAATGYCAIISNPEAVPGLLGEQLRREAAFGNGGSQRYRHTGNLSLR